jgi:hypothetical protein
MLYYLMLRPHYGLPPSNCQTSAAQQFKFLVRYYLGRLYDINLHQLYPIDMNRCSFEVIYRVLLDLHCFQTPTSLLICGLASEEKRKEELRLMLLRKKKGGVSEGFLEKLASAVTAPCDAPNVCNCHTQQQTR